ncbi:GatB/YqeY domain-containing protein [Bacillus subtilis]|uniref:Transamidase GatB domain protein n=2 Tax=Zhangjivirus TaxID=3044867 RepID=A0AAE9G9Y6_9CAUD|nr:MULTISPECIES: GatB/YqeY domain-containing protein [Bacillus subtilis group]YP_010681700.1 GatB/YqeY domain-containing protein [Bacillus phage vB_BsuS_PJN02]YP_010740208.1 transamidase GatB domain protein [Bacillus phage FADO]MCR4362007.1 GatB/YqeY domain-containing protein [Bacillus subtilis]UNH58425.1 GatB/YqeY domain-containing protein [Bacillus phage vB_BsuS_PJN02]UNY48906.1 transamidase GatB domain protein [Bacillus phage FADO]UQB84374.1 GatB/YqeY domain-containing protein [Bacillus am
MALVDKIKSDSMKALKEKDTAKLNTLRLLIAKLEKEKVANKLTEVTGLSDEQAQAVVVKNIKELDKEIESYKEVGRSTEKQEAEKTLLLTYLPKQLTDEEIENHVAYAFVMVGKGEIKNPMQYLSKELKGKADMSRVMKVVNSYKK